jgi:hypothetical protein
MYKMTEKHFYFLNDQYYIDFPDKYLMQNKETVNGVTHDRPCYYAFKDKNYPDIYWMIPFSSKINKFHKVYNDKIAKNGKCDTILFADILGYEKAFLIQNMCPVSAKYIKNKYVDSTGPVRLSQHQEQELQKKASQILALVEKGYRNLVFPDILKIKNKLIEDLKNSAS